MAKSKMKGVTSINRKGVDYWYARIDGKKQYCGIGDKGKKIAEAAKAKEITKKYENREVSAGLRVKKQIFKTVKDLANWYMTLPSVQEKKAYKRKVAACSHILDFFGDMPLNQIEGDTQEKYRQIRKNKGAADATVDIEIQFLRTFYLTALRRKRINSDHVPGEFILYHNVNPRRTVTDDEFKKLAESANDYFRDVIICGYESAMRLSEIIKLTASQIFLDVQHISGNMVDYIDLGTFDTKTGARRTVPVSPTLKEILKNRLVGLQSDDYIFLRKNGKRYTQQGASQQMKYTCEKAGVPYGDKLLNHKGERTGIVFHCLRHTRISKWVEMGFSDEIIRRASGHKSLDAYRRYIKLDPHAVMRLVIEPKIDKVDKNGIKSTGTL